MEDRIIKYSIYKNKVWGDVYYKGVPMNSKVVYSGTSKKDCERWIKENAKKNR